MILVLVSAFVTYYNSGPSCSFPSNESGWEPEKSVVTFPFHCTPFVLYARKKSRVGLQTALQLTRFWNTAFVESLQSVFS